jgi:hypothetical protein
MRTGEVMKLKLYSASAFVLLMLLLSCSGTDDNDELAKLNYKSERYSFALTFPERWKNYVVFEKQDLIAPGFMVETLYFALPTRARNWQPLNVPDNFAALFKIRIFDVKIWDNYYSRFRDSDIFFDKNSKVIFKGERYVYLLSYSVSIPVDLYAYSRDVEPVVATFRYIE